MPGLHDTNFPKLPVVNFVGDYMSQYDVIGTRIWLQSSSGTDLSRLADWGVAIVKLGLETG